MTQIKVNAILKNKDRILVLKRCAEDGGFWQTVTGTVEYDENLSETVKREIQEEAGICEIEIDEIPVHYFIWKKGNDDVVEVVYLVKTKEEKVRLSKEHTDFLWLEPTVAIQRVGKQNNKIAIEKVTVSEAQLLKKSIADKSGPNPKARAKAARFL